MTSGPWDAIIVGGGFFGARLAIELGRHGAQTLLLEAGPALLERASARNQARVHAGYHYPRSYLTALRSRINAPRFIAEFRECIFDDFTHYYAVGRTFSNITGAQFRRFCERIGARTAPPPVTIRGPTAEDLVPARRVFNCTYAALNRLNSASGLPIIPLKHELTEMALVELPQELARIGVTVMCGPFFSLLPYPPRGLCTLSHVRYTPHSAWHERPGLPPVDPDARLAEDPHISAYPHMIRDAARYLPAMTGCRQVDSLWEVKTVLPRSETDDSRPILFSSNHGIPGYHCVTGSKLDNVYDMLEVLMDAPDGTAEAS